MSALSDTTVLAASTAKVPLFSHIRYMMYTTVPTFVIALLIYTVAGLCIYDSNSVISNELVDALHGVFNISPWLLVCTFSLSMFLALCKRKNEMETALESRAVLRHYHPRILTVLIVLAALGSVAEYLTYTVTSQMGMRFPHLWVTAVFVFLGIARYLCLAWKKGSDVGRPERILLSDKLLWLAIGGYAVSAVLAVVLGL